MNDKNTESFSSLSTPIKISANEDSLKLSQRKEDREFPVKLTFDPSQPLPKIDYELFAAKIGYNPSELTISSSANIVAPINFSEHIHAVIDVFENFLDKKGIEIPNKDKVGGEDEAIIFSEDFDELYKALVKVYKSVSPIKGIIDQEYRNGRKDKDIFYNY